MLSCFRYNLYGIVNFHNAIKKLYIQICKKNLTEYFNYFVSLYFKCFLHEALFFLIEKSDINRKKRNTLFDILIKVINYLLEIVWKALLIEFEFCTGTMQKKYWAVRKEISRSRNKKTKEEKEKIFQYLKDKKTWGMRFYVRLHIRKDVWRPFTIVFIKRCKTF